MILRRLAPVAVLATALVAGGCAGAGSDSSKKFKGDQHDVAKALENFSDAASRRDEGAICSKYLATTLVDAITAAGKKSGNTNCKDQLHDSLRDTDTFNLTVTKVTVNGTNATAVVKTDLQGSKKRYDTLTLVKEGTPPKWKIASLG